MKRLAISVWRLLFACHLAFAGVAGLVSTVATAGPRYPDFNGDGKTDLSTNVAKRFAGLPALPAFRLLAVGETWASHSSHTFHLL